MTGLCPPFQIENTLEEMEAETEDSSRRSADSSESDTDSSNNSDSSTSDSQGSSSDESANYHNLSPSADDPTSSSDNSPDEGDIKSVPSKKKTAFSRVWQRHKEDEQLTAEETTALTYIYEKILNLLSKFATYKEQQVSISSLLYIMSQCRFHLMRTY